ncbi:MAG: glycosyltransferase family 39 protein [Sandaracinaceae bacterium]|nr:glycosyltransferase family 39 protein [Sandaracinaceae bacterium]
MNAAPKSAQALVFAGLGMLVGGALLGLFGGHGSTSLLGFAAAALGGLLVTAGSLVRSASVAATTPPLGKRGAMPTPADVTAGEDLDVEEVVIPAEWSPGVAGMVIGASLTGICALLFVRIGSYGIWDPWELSSADLARQVLSGESVELAHPPLGTWLVAAGFGVFGVHEWAGRLPIALAGLVTVGLAYAVAARFAGRRAGVLAAIVTATSPLLLFNSREMLGEAPAFAASAGVFLCGLSAVFRPGSLKTPARRRLAVQLAWLGGLGISAALATMASGALLGVAPPLLAVGVAIVARGELEPPFAERGRAAAAAVVLVIAVAAGLGAAWAVYADYAGFGYWTGGVARGGDPPTWEIAIEHVFHSFAPWSGLLPVALAAMLARAPRPPGIRVRHAEENALRLAVFAWTAFGYLAETVFTARFGPATFLPLVGISVAVALFLHDVERTPRARWGVAIVSVLFVALILRDYHAYPGGPVEGLGVDGLTVPEEFNPTAGWAIFLAAFIAVAGLGFGADPSSEHASLSRDFAWIRERWVQGGGARAGAVVGALRIGVPVDLVVEQWKRGPGYRVWIVILGGILPLVFLVLGLVAVVAGEWMGAQFGSSLAVRIVRVALFVPFGVIGAIAAARLALFGFAKLGRNRLVPLLLAGLAVGGFASFGYQPALSSHFSPREVYDTYNALAGSREPLGEFRVGGRAAAYYVREGQELEEIDSQPALLDFLMQERRVWAAFRADDLAAINREYRRRAGRHLFVADARSARMLLATNIGVPDRDNENYLADAVLDAPPAHIQHPVHIDFDHRIVLIGYDLELPHETYVGPGEAFTITWYFQVNAAIPGTYAPFVHMDGAGQRLNGDHEPVDGRYPVRLWEEGDVVADRQEIRVPANYGRGNLTIFMGFWAGDNRLEVVEGPADDVNRARVGVLPIR